MAIRPVSFGSLMVFTLKDGKPKADVPTYVRTAFKNNEQLKGYELKEGYKYEDEIDGTVHNAAKNFAITLDQRYAKDIKPKQVNLTQAEFSVSPRKTETRYFLTASTREEEAALLKILSKGSTLYVAKFM